ncbi:hypothetical protein MTR_4g123955 [Medicago truncatula]|uniref:Uncharacterized protein n=1 Tax=Medicago truncatula TaxID=3880 RepID=A0A072URH7_MEDTR|nr:hypothetical protein MTR_4g123955 [Medicago truncatula]
MTIDNVTWLRIRHKRQSYKLLQHSVCKHFARIIIKTKREEYFAKSSWSIGHANGLNKSYICCLQPGETILISS